MNRKIPRLLGALAVAISLIASTLAGTAVAATPHWTASVVGTPGQVSAGATVGYVVTFTNGPNATSNIAQLFMNMATPAGSTFAGVIAPSSVMCTPPLGTAPLLCSYGAVNAGVTVIVTVVYNAPASGSTSATANFNTTGATGSDRGGNSHGDTLSATSQTVGISTSNRDFAGRFVFDPNAASVFDDQTLTNKNKQSTQVNSPAVNIPVTVGESALGSFSCPAEANNQCFSQWSEIHVNNGTSYLLSGGFSLVIGLSSFELPSNVDITNLKFVHVRDDGSFLENITDTCNSPTGPTNMPCMILTQSGKNILATLWVTENGRINGW